MKTQKEKLKELKNTHRKKRSEILKSLESFRKNLDSEKNILCELIFCLLTTQSKAKSCWEAVLELNNKNLIRKNAPRNDISQILQKKTRFHNNKAQYIKNVLLLFNSENLNLKNIITDMKSEFELRKWLVKNIKGLGLKEAGHFLRNIGLGADLAILDRHILKNLLALGVISEIPKTLTEKIYLETEEKMRQFCKKADIPMTHIDLLFWSNETGEIFK